MLFALLLFLAYMLGAIPFGLLLGRAFAEVDIREFGSGNIGATNVNRVLGRKLGAATLLCDFLKGILPALVARILLEDIYLATWVGFAAVIGHCFPIYLQFKGGKGVATAFGALAAIVPVSAGVALISWLLAVRISSISAVGALVACGVLPIVTFILSRDFYLSLMVAAMSLLIVVRHRENIRQLTKGTSS